MIDYTFVSSIRGQGRIRTAEAVKQQIYSLPVLTTYLPTRRCDSAFSNHEETSFSKCGCKGTIFFVIRKLFDLFIAKNMNICYILVTKTTHFVITTRKCRLISVFLPVRGEILNDGFYLLVQMQESITIELRYLLSLIRRAIYFNEWRA